MNIPIVAGDISSHQQSADVGGDTVARSCTPTDLRLWALDDLARSGIEPDRAAELGFRSATAEEITDLVGFTLPERVDGFVIPYTDPTNGQPMLTPAGGPFLRIKTAHPVRWSDGSRARYLSPAGSGQHAYVPQEAHQAFNTGQRIVVTEGEKKAVCATDSGIPCIGLPGYCGWNVSGSDRLLPELERYATSGREWVIVWDADGAPNPDFGRSSARLAKALLDRGCKVRFHYLHPAQDPRAKVGLDDFLCSRPPQSSREDRVRALLDVIDSQTQLVESAADVPLGVLPSWSVLMAWLTRFVPPDSSVHVAPDDALLEKVLKACACRLALEPRERQGLIRERLLTAVERLGFRSPAKVLDGYLKAAPGRIPEATAGTGLQFLSDAPASEPVDGAVLASAIRALFIRHVILPIWADVALTLWILFSYVHDSFETSPLLVIRSAVKRSAKTLCLDILDMLVPKPLRTVNQTPAVLFRLIDQHTPTLLVDEADQWFRSDELVGIINGGHRAQGAFVQRCEGDDHIVRQFRVWAPKCIALIGKLPSDTTEDRAIVVPMKRKSKTETVERWRMRKREDFAELRGRIVRWVADNAEELRVADPTMPDELNDRAADNWRPLFAIAGRLGGEWPRLVRETAIGLCGLAEADADDTLGIQLLDDIRRLFQEQGGDRVPTADLLSSLIGLEGQPWAEVSAGKPLTPRRLATLLKPFGIRPTDAKVGGRTLKTYMFESFDDAFRRYLAPVPDGMAPSAPVADGCPASVSPAPQCATIQTPSFEENAPTVAPVAQGTASQDHVSVDHARILV